MNIVLEGIDNSGKSTLAAVLAGIFQTRVQGSEGPPHYSGEMDERITRYLKEDRIIFDRHPCVSQVIYGTYRGNVGFDQQLVQVFYDTKPLIVYCDPVGRGLVTHRTRPEVDTAAHLSFIKQHYDELLGAYRDWAVSKAHFMYRIGDDEDKLLKSITAVWKE